MKVLQGQKLHESDYADIQSQLEEIFFNLLFKPIVDLLAPKNAQVKAAKKDLKNSKSLLNAKFSPIVSAINSGKVQYVGDTFSGDFSAAISKALRSYGAKWNRREKTYSIQPGLLPVEVLAAAKDYSDTATQLHADLDARLDAIQKSLEGSVAGINIRTGKTIDKMSKRFDQAYGDALSLESLTPHAKEKLDKAYRDDLTPYIKDFSEDMIAEIRGIVAENARQGYRFDTLVDKLQGRFGVTKTKANFLARQETSMFTSQVREQRFGDVGIFEYDWDTSGDSNVRPDHKALDGKRFKFSDPPVVDKATGRKGNPGEDFGCRCLARPVIPNFAVGAA